MGSIENCSFVYEKTIEKANELRELYENNCCEFLTLSSVGPAFMAIVKNEEQKEICKDTMQKVGMNVIETSICNSTYTVKNKEEKTIFWQNEEVAKKFTEKPVSQYIVKEIEEISNKRKIDKVIDIGCGGGRYSRYLNSHGYNVLAVDKYKEMAFSLKKENIEFVQANMDNIPTSSEIFDIILSIGVIHNATTRIEFINTIKEFNRILKKNGYVILSVFTNDIITEDLKYLGKGVYEVENRPPMVLLSKEEISQIVKENGFYIEKNVDEHITDVGIGKRNVYTIRLKK